MVIQRGRKKSTDGDFKSHTSSGAQSAIPTVAEYNKHAEECRKLADLTAKPEAKKAFEDLAHT